MLNSANRIQPPHRVWWALLPALGHAALIFYLSSRPALLTTVHIPHLDKLFHAVTFGLLAWLMAWGLLKVFPDLPRGQLLALTLTMAVCYGALDELHQYFVPSRTSDNLDLVADAVGTLLVVGYLWRPRRWWASKA